MMKTAIFALFGFSLILNVVSIPLPQRYLFGQQSSADAMAAANANTNSFIGGGGHVPYYPTYPGLVPGGMPVSPIMPVYPGFGGYGSSSANAAANAQSSSNVGGNGIYY